VDPEASHTIGSENAIMKWKTGHFQHRNCPEFNTEGNEERYGLEMQLADELMIVKVSS